MKTMPPLGVAPLDWWVRDNDDPSLADLLDRYRDVSAAVKRYRDAGLTVPFQWLVELGTVPRGRLLA